MIWDDLWNTSKNQMVLFAEKGIKPHYGNLISSNGHINPVISEKLAVSPVVKRAVSQTFSVFNELVDSYGDFDYVTIELAREQNEIEQKAFYRKMQKNNESLHQLVADTIGLKHQGGLFTKVKLYYLQDGKDLYTGLPIDLDHLIANPFAYAINHIIPLSISFDDSLSNKVLTTAEISSEKGQRTPYQYLSEAEFEKMQRYIYQIKDAAVGENSNTVPKMPKRKLENLLFKGDITKWDVQKGFIHRNLVDTRYASREVSLAIKECFASVEKSTKVYTVNGSWTYYLRKKWGIEKDRDKDFSYRAMDALVIASSPLVFSTLKTIKLYDSFDMGFVVNHETGEVINMEELEIDLKNNLEQFAKLGHNFERYQDIKYSHKVDKKANRGLFNDTLYSTRYLTKVVAATKRKSEHKETTEWKVSFLTDLYDPKADLKKLELLFCKEPERLLIYQHDRLTFAKLKEVYSNPDYQKDEAGKKANPFTIFHLKTGKYVTKYAKHNDGPPIKRLKYLSEAINGYRLDLSEKQGCKRNKRVIVENTPTYRIDVFYDGEFYKFLVVRYHMLSSKNHKIIQHLYEEERNRRAISEEFIFQFSLYSNDLFELNGKIYRFAGVQARNCIVAKSIDTNDKYTPSIGKKTKSLNKVTSSVLGKAF